MKSEAIPRVCFATSNSNKVQEAQKWCRFPIEAVPLELPELQTDSLHELVEFKLITAYEHLQKPVMVEDTSLFFEAWNGLPGPFIKWFIKGMGLEQLYRSLAVSQSFESHAICCVGWYDGEQCVLAEGRIDGSIVSPRGKLGFGWDPIFQPEGSQKTLAEMNSEQKREFSMRQKAFEALAQQLEKM